MLRELEKRNSGRTAGAISSSADAKKEEPWWLMGTTTVGNRIESEKRHNKWLSVTVQLLRNIKLFCGRFSMILTHFYIGNSLPKINHIWGPHLCKFHSFWEALGVINESWCLICNAFSLVCHIRRIIYEVEL